MTREEIIQTYLRCPICNGCLIDITCLSCGQIFPTNQDIIDLRLPDKDTKTADDEILISQLFAHFENTDFTQLMNIRFQQTAAPAEFVIIYKDYQSGLQKRGRLMLEMFQKRLKTTFEIPDNFLALDLGCGVGASSAILAQQFQWVIGVDPSLPDLILAKKYFSEQNIDNVILIRASAQNLPIQSNSISLAVALNVIEHLFEVDAAFIELNRVLKWQGVFCADSRNRFDPFFPEPHAQLRWVGYWPRRLQPWYVKTFRNIPYSSAYLLSWFELRRHCRAAFGNSYAILMPHVSAYGQSSRIDKIREVLEKIPILKTLATIFFPSHLLLAQKNQLSA